MTTLTPPPGPFKPIDLAETDDGTTGGPGRMADCYTYGLTHLKTGVEVKVAGYETPQYAQAACLGALAVAVWIFETERDNTSG